MNRIEHDVPSTAFQRKRSQPVDSGLLRRLLHAVGDPAVEVRLANGAPVCTSSRPAVARMTIADRMTLLKLSANPALRFGEAYSAGRIRVDGDLTGLIAEFYRAEQLVRSRAAGGASWRPMARTSRPHSLSASRANVHHHYDIGNDFYALWLGSTMAYTCAYFPTREATLDEAQIAKMRHVSRKLRLRPGDRVIEAGCGWGAQALLMAREYGVKVTAFNISTEQISYARERAQAAGLAGEVEFIEDDYRNLGAGSGKSFDAFVSIGMLEHVGKGHYAELGRLMRNCLKPSGLGLIHSIGRNQPLPLNPWIEKHIFPGAYVPSLAEMMSIFEPSGLSILDVENLRLHYAKTLGRWRDAFEQSSSTVAETFDDDFVRTWRLYLAGSEAAFLAGELQLFQVLCAPECNNEVPWTRADIYGGGANAVL